MYVVMSGPPTAIWLLLANGSVDTQNRSEKQIGFVSWIRPCLHIITSTTSMWTPSGWDSTQCMASPIPLNTITSQWSPTPKTIYISYLRTCQLNICSFWISLSRLKCCPTAGRGVRSDKTSSISTGLVRKCRASVS